MARILELRALVNRQLEGCRSRGELGASLEAQLQLVLEPAGDGQSVVAAEGVAAAKAAAAVDAVAVPDAAAATGGLAAALALLAASPQPAVDNLADWLLVSACHLCQPGEAPLANPLAEERAVLQGDVLTVRVARAAGDKCERCWHYESDIGQHVDHPTLCGRCVTVLQTQPA